MNKFISIVLALTSAVLLVSFGKTDAACGAPSPDTDPVGYCKQFYDPADAAGAIPNTNCQTGGDSACKGGLVCINDGEVGDMFFRCECPLYRTIQSQIYANNNFQCTSPLLDQSRSCACSPCAGSYFCATGTCSNHVCYQPPN